MRNVIKWGRVLAFSVALISALIPAWSIPASSQLLMASIPSLQLAKGERVIGFEFQITSGRIASLPNAPIGWNVIIDNDASWNTSIKASIMVGAAALAPGLFQKFLVVEKDKSSHEQPFEMRGEVIVTSDFEHERRIKVGMKDFALRSIPKH